MSAPGPLRNAVIALLAIAGIGGGVVVVAPVALEQYREDSYLMLIAQDEDTAPEVKIGMVLAAYYESGFRVRQVPYRDELSAARPWTVCNGVTDAGMPRGFPAINPARSYSLAECYRIERALFIGYADTLPRYVPTWGQASAWQRATVLDFVHHFGIGAFAGSTMRRKASAGDWPGACDEHARWKYTTLPSGVKTILAGLETRADANVDICRWTLPVLPTAGVFVEGFEEAA